MVSAICLIPTLSFSCCPAMAQWRQSLMMQSYPHPMTPTLHNLGDRIAADALRIRFGDVAQMVIGV